MLTLPQVSDIWLHELHWPTSKATKIHIKGSQIRWMILGCTSAPWFRPLTFAFFIVAALWLFIEVDLLLLVRTLFRIAYSTTHILPMSVIWFFVDIFLVISFTSKIHKCICVYLCKSEFLTYSKEDSNVYLLVGSRSAFASLHHSEFQVFDSILIVWCYDILFCAFSMIIILITTRVHLATWLGACRPWAPGTPTEWNWKENCLREYQKQ